MLQILREYAEPSLGIKAFTNLMLFSVTKMPNISSSNQLHHIPETDNGI